VAQAIHCCVPVFDSFWNCSVETLLPYSARICSWSGKGKVSFVRQELKNDNISHQNFIFILGAGAYTCNPRYFWRLRSRGSRFEASPGK
jgi:hypothetical protein